MKRCIRVLIVDNNAVVRQGLLALISSATDMEVVGEAANAARAVELLQHSQPDVIVLDPMMPGPQGAGAVRAIKKENRYVRILVLSDASDEEHVLAALRAGAHGYLLKDAVLSDILEAIQQVYDGKIVLHPTITPILMQAIYEP